IKLSQMCVVDAPTYMMAKNSMILAAMCIGKKHKLPEICMWPRTTIRTAAVQYALGGSEMYGRSRTPEVYSDSAHAVLTAEPTKYAGRTMLCEDVLEDAGVTDFAKYSPGIDPSELEKDIFVD